MEQHGRENPLFPHRHIHSGGCLGGHHNFAYCHACRCSRCRYCGAYDVPQHNHPTWPIPYGRDPHLIYDNSADNSFRYGNPLDRSTH